MSPCQALDSREQSTRKYERVIWEKVPPVLFRVRPFSIFADPTISLGRGALSPVGLLVITCIMSVVTVVELSLCPVSESQVRYPEMKHEVVINGDLDNLSGFSVTTWDPVRVFSMKSKSRFHPGQFLIWDNFVEKATIWWKTCDENDVLSRQVPIAREDRDLGLLTWRHQTESAGLLGRGTPPNLITLLNWQEVVWPIYNNNNNNNNNNSNNIIRPKWPFQTFSYKICYQHGSCIKISA